MLLNLSLRISKRRGTIWKWPFRADKLGKMSLSWKIQSFNSKCFNIFFEVNDFLHVTHLDPEEELVARLSEATGKTHHMTGVFQIIHQSPLRRWSACITIADHCFQQLLKFFHFKLNILIYAYSCIFGLKFLQRFCVSFRTMHSMMILFCFGVCYPSPLKSCSIFFETSCILDIQSYIRLPIFKKWY